MAVIIIFSTVVVQDEGHDFIEVIIGIVQKEKKNHSPYPTQSTVWE